MADGVTEWLIVVRAIHFATSAIIAGVLIFRFCVAEPKLRFAPIAADTFQKIILRVAWFNLAIAAASGVAWIFLQASAMSGLPFGDAITSSAIGTVVTETQFGLVWITRLGLECALAASLAFDRHVIARRLGLICAVCFAAGLAVTGHAGATEGASGPIHVASDVMHVVAAAAWMGGLVSLPILIKTVRDQASTTWPSLVRDATDRFSKIAFASVTGLLISGLINASMLVGSLRTLPTTDYGKLLILKVALFFGMLMLAAINKFRLTPQIGLFPPDRRDLEATQSLSQNCMLEIALGLAIFLIVGSLGLTHPAIHFGSSQPCNPTDLPMTCRSQPRLG
jgi:putative copper resistance protein D